MPQQFASPKHSGGSTFLRPQKSRERVLHFGPVGHSLGGWPVARGLGRSRGAGGADADASQVPVLEAFWPFFFSGPGFRRIFGKSRSDNLGCQNIAGVHVFAATAVRGHSFALICLGKPGTGKSSVAIAECIRAAELGARVLVMCPTAQLAAKFKTRFQHHDNVDVDTCHAACKFNSDLAEVMHSFSTYDNIVCDEISLLDDVQFERTIKLWSVSEKVPALTILGDKHQLAGHGERRAWESGAWRSCSFCKLHVVYRQSEDERSFREILDALRTAKPSRRMFRNIVRSRKAWSGKDPTPQCLKQLFFTHPKTRIVTCTRRGAADINDAAVLGIYGKFGRNQQLVPKKPLGVIHGDVECNPDNYVDGKFCTDRAPKPYTMRIYKGMLLYITHNVRKEDDFINGMQCRVEAFVDGVLRVRTRTGHRLVVTPWTNSELQYASYFPVRYGYASTIHKTQGDEVEHITIVLDAKMPAAAYTALSRVASSDDYLIGGPVTREHFMPAM